MNFKLYIEGENGEIKAQATGQKLELLYQNQYTPGDVICLSADKPGFIVAQLEDSMPPVLGWLQSEFRMPVPFDLKKAGHSPKNFSGEKHMLFVRPAREWEVSVYRNVAFNPLDCHENTGFFPHAAANVETRGESVFAARNAINGGLANHDHGPWPYESWGINRREDAEIRVDFGVPATIDRLVITLRADFPHDNWWKQATIEFSDGSTFTPQFIKTDQPQEFSIPPRKVVWAKMLDMKKDESDPSPFPALTQIEFWGVSEKQ